MSTLEMIIDNPIPVNPTPNKTTAASVFDMISLDKKSKGLA
jgi:hypothetical protein